MSAGGFTSNDLYPRVLGDVNGDGRADIVGFGSAGVYTSPGQANGTFAVPILALSGLGADVSAGGWTSNNLYPRVLGDVNGDGRADIVAFGAAGVSTALGQTNGSFAAPILALSGLGADVSAGGFTSNDLYPRVLGDVNGDGRADIVAFGAAGVSTALGRADGSFTAPVQPRQFREQRCWRRLDQPEHLSAVRRGRDRRPPGRPRRVRRRRCCRGAIALIVRPSPPNCRCRKGQSQISYVDGWLGIAVNSGLRFEGAMILRAIVEKLKRRSKDDFKGRHFEASLQYRADQDHRRDPPLSRRPARAGAEPLGPHPG